MKRRITLYALLLASVASPSLGAENRAPSPRELVEVTDLSGVAVSPDGRWAAFRTEKASIERNVYDSRWYVIDTQTGGSRRGIADGGPPLRNYGGVVVTETPQWSPDSRWIYYRANLGGEVQVWRASTLGDRTEQVTHDPADVETYTLAADGRTLSYTVGATREAIAESERRTYDSGVLIDGGVPIGQGLIGSALYNGRPLTERFTGRWMTRQGLLGDRPKQTRQIDLISREVGEVESVNSSSTSDRPGARRSPDGEWSAFIASDEPDMGLRAVDRRGVETRWICSDPVCEVGAVEGFGWRPGSTEVLFTFRTRKHPYAHSLYAWDVRSGASRLIVETDGLLNSGAYFGTTCGFSKSQAICVAASATVPPHLERVDLTTGVREVIYNPNPTLTDVGTISVDYLEWNSPAGVRFTGYLALPTSRAPGTALPLVINYYACTGYLRGAAGEEWPMAALAEAGVATLCVNSVRQTSGDDRESDRENALAAISSIVEQLSGRGIIDRKRVGLSGLSAGGEFATYVAANTDLISAVSVTGISLTETWYFTHALQPDFPGRVLERWGVGLPEQTPEQWRKLSATYHVERLRMPFLMQPPEQEYIDLVEFYSRMVLAGNPAELYVFPNEPHLKTQPRHKLAAYVRNLDWFRFWFQGYEDPDPAKRDQYKRWRQLRERATGREAGN